MYFLDQPFSIIFWRQAFRASGPNEEAEVWP
jgi:hypothetical protein